MGPWSSARRSHDSFRVRSVDAALENSIRNPAVKGTRLFIPWSGKLGLDGSKTAGLGGSDDHHEEELQKPELDAAPMSRSWDHERDLAYDGPTHGILFLFPKNVNSHATLALASLVWTEPGPFCGRS
jgi:predicted dinucleotide-utilizing enzyme